MLLPALVELFKLKLVGSVIVLTCSWSADDKVKFTRQLAEYGLKTTFSCNPDILSKVAIHRFQGILYFKEKDDRLLDQVKREYFSHWYKWLIIGEELPKAIHDVRFDADIVYVNSEQTGFSRKETFEKQISFQDVFVHPSQGASLHPWAYWTQETGLKETYNRERILRRYNLKQYMLRVITPVGFYSPSVYNYTFDEYLRGDEDIERDPSMRCGYRVSSLIVESLNASQTLIATNSWNSLTNNNSMVRQISGGRADITGATYRFLAFRLELMDYVIPSWPFRVGFTYISDRESASNMYVEPFTGAVWWTCLGIGIILAFCQRITARRIEEKEGAFISVLATWLQQDASAVPEGASGRWAFIVMSTSAMLVHAYYTSAVVSALMSSGRGGPTSLRALGDSKYAIASEDYEYMRLMFWDTKTNWTDLEYLKSKKMSPKMFTDTKSGIKLIQEGNTAYHTEFNLIYPHMKVLTDDQLCKLQFIDTIPEQPAWITTHKRGQYTNIFRSRGAWLFEIGLVQRSLKQLLMLPPPCRAAMLAERVTFGDVTELLVISMLGVLLSIIVLGLEILHAKWKRDGRLQFFVTQNKSIDDDIVDKSVVSDATVEKDLA